MSVLSLNLERHLARTVAFTGELKHKSRGVRLLDAATGAVDFVARGVFYAWRNRRYLTIRKLANMGLINLQQKFKTQYVLGRPYGMKIESTNICNTSCQLCPTGLGLKGRPKGSMSLAQFKDLIDRIRWHLMSLDLSMWGDPLIVPDIYGMIRYAHDKGVWTYISSNLHAFKADKGHAKKLVESGLDLLTCSLHGATQETFEIYQPGKRLDQAIEKIRHIVATRDEMGQSSPQLQLNFVVTRHNEHEIEDFKKLADELDCKPVFSTASMNMRFQNQDENLTSLGLAPDLLAKKRKAHLEDWLPENREYVLEPYSRIIEDGKMDDDWNGKKQFDCSWPWKNSVINWDGQVVTCCGNYDPAEDMGSVFEQSFGKIWNGKKYRMARRSFKKPVDADQVQGNACAGCPGFML